VNSHAEGPAFTSKDVERALAAEHRGEPELMALLSPAAAPFLEVMARQAELRTRQRFGRTMQLFAPLYLSNECVNTCTYCGFSRELAIARRTLSVAEVDAEAQRLRAEGFRHLLVVSGESPRHVDLGYLDEVVRTLGRHFDSLSLEIGSRKPAELEHLAALGIDGFVLYQETYLAELYPRLHLTGPKRNAARRLQAMDDAGRAGFRSLGLGALLSLGPWREEALALYRHARALTEQYWRSRIALSFPRLRPHAGGQVGSHPVTDRELVQLVVAMRLLLPDAELVLSTREPAWLRDGLMRLGITRMSAGSRTNPGGYAGSADSGEQFAIDDTRSAGEVAAALRKEGLEPVWKDFDRSFLAPVQPELRA